VVRRVGRKTKTMKAVLAGGSGFLGESLGRALAARGDEVVILTRRRGSNSGRLRYVSWDAQNLGPWVQEVDGANCIFNFTGKSVNCIYTAANRKEILESRIDSVRVIHRAIGECRNPPSILCQAGSLAIYGDTVNDCDETAPHGDGFSVDVCEKWEEEFFKESHAGVRSCLFRIGFVLGRDGGALASLAKLTGLYLGGTVGSGKQYISWIHINDMNAMFLFAVENTSIEGVYNATGPSPVTNREFMAALRRAMGRPWSPPVPSVFVKIGARVIMKADASLALTGRKCYPTRMVKGGFKFEYPDLDSALVDILQ